MCQTFFHQQSSSFRDNSASVLCLQIPRSYYLYELGQMKCVDHQPGTAKQLRMQRTFTSVAPWMDVSVQPTCKKLKILGNASGTCISHYNLWFNPFLFIDPSNHECILYISSNQIHCCLSFSGISLHLGHCLVWWLVHFQYKSWMIRLTLSKTNPQVLVSRKFPVILTLYQWKRSQRLTCK